MAENDNVDDDDLDGDLRPETRLYLARWPDGTATLLSARSLVEAASLLDEIDNPGACEVVRYDGPVCFQIRPSADPARAYSTRCTSPIYRGCPADGSLSG